MKQRKSVIALLLVAIIGIVGLTFAYFANSTEVENIFTTKEYGTTYTEQFVSPDNWLPGDTTNKTITATNTGQVDQAVRISLSQEWVSHNGDTLALSKNGVTAAVLNLANTSDWTKVGDYYYYNYKLAPGETTTSFLESVTFNKDIELDDTCTESVNNGVRTNSCNSSGDDYDNATYTLTLTIETVQYNKYASAWGTGNSVAIAEERPEPPVPGSGSEYLVNNATNPANTEYNATTKGNMFTFTHGEGANAVNETRYIGDEPKNYVKFNCDDDGTNCETWRILGVFSVDDGTGNVEQRIKLVRGSDFATNKAFNSSFNNDWTVSPLNTLLNGDYYNRTGDAATYGLKASARGMIGNAVYYLGAVSWDSTYSNLGSTSKIYGEERGTTVCGACNSDTTKLTWTGIVGLMYPSDEYMVYGNGVNASCYDNPYGCNGTNAQTGWVYKSNIVEGQSSPYNTWLLSSNAGSSHFVLLAFSDGFLGSDYSYFSHGVRPVVYLKSNIKIADGTGEVGNPYTLEEIQ